MPSSWPLNVSVPVKPSTPVAGASNTGTPRDALAIEFEVAGDRFQPIKREHLAAHFDAEASRFVCKPTRASFVAGGPSAVDALRIPCGQPRNRPCLGLVNRVGRSSHHPLRLMCTVLGQFAVPTGGAQRLLGHNQPCRHDRAR